MPNYNNCWSTDSEQTMPDSSNAAQVLDTPQFTLYNQPEDEEPGQDLSPPLLLSSQQQQQTMNNGDSKLLHRSNSLQHQHSSTSSSGSTLGPAPRPKKGSEIQLQELLQRQSSDLGASKEHLQLALSQIAVQPDDTMQPPPPLANHIHGKS